METAQLMAAFNAVLVTASGVLIIRGVRLIRRGDRDRHMRSMVTAAALATLFLVLYLLRISLFGLTPFPGPDWAKRIYLFVLFSHILVAVISTPLVIATLFAAWRGKFDRHRRVARISYPLWLYVAFTGPLVYLMLYHWFR